jgi:hypothetical protein
MKNVIFTYKQTAVLTDNEQSEVNKIPYSQIHDMQTISEIINAGTDKEIEIITTPYQANLKDDVELNTLKAFLETKGVVTIIGIWLEDGTKESLDFTAYHNMLKLEPIIEQYITVGGVDTLDLSVTTDILDRDGKVVLDLDGNALKQAYVPKIRIKQYKKLTIAKAKSFQVARFNNNFSREL